MTDGTNNIKELKNELELQMESTSQNKEGTKYIKEKLTDTHMQVLTSE